MRLEFPTQLAAQAVADRIHASMIARHPSYAANVAAGQTTAWAKPYQDLDEVGQPLNTLWYVNLKTRAMGTLTVDEQARLKPYRGAGG